MKICYEKNHQFLLPIVIDKPLTIVKCLGILPRQKIYMNYKIIANVTRRGT